METKILGRINNVDIQVVENNNEELVPIKPICEALGIDWKSQYDKLKNDEILSPTVVLSTTVGGDKKDREMVCLPVKYVFGWLFTINPKNVKADARETIIKYKLLCYDTLYDFFYGKNIQRTQSLKRTISLQSEIERLRHKPNKLIEDFERYLDIERELRLETSLRKSLTRANISEMKSLFE